MGRVGRVIPRFSTALNNARVRNTLGYAGKIEWLQRQSEPTHTARVKQLITLILWADLTPG